MTYRPQNMTVSQSFVAMTLILGIATVLAVPMATAWVWRSIQGAFEGDALDFYDIADD